MTKIEYFEYIKNECNGNEKITAFCDKQIESLKKRNSRTNSKKKAETEARANRLYSALAEMDKAVTFKELRELTSDEEVKSYSPQRMSALVRYLGDKVKKEYIQKDAYFSVV